MPAAEVSQQISLAGTEASGTGNMKFSLNGALTVGTLDGANIEIREAVGAENFFLFGLKAQQVEILKQRGYNPYYYYENDQRIRRIMDFVISDNINSSEPGKYKALADLLLQNGDQYCLRRIWKITSG
jgi:starch phosphorylase